MQAVIMAGGEGRRLRPLTDFLPKPLVPVVGRSVLEHVLAYLRRQGVEEAIVTLGYRGEDIRTCIGDGSHLGIRVRYVSESRPLGTAGGVRQALDVLKGTFLVLSGDVLALADLARLVALHQSAKNAASICLVEPDSTFPYGLVQPDTRGRVVRFLEKPQFGDLLAGFGVNAGVYVLEPEALRLVPPGVAFDFSRDLFPALLREGASVGAYFLTTYWRDVGTLDSYLQAHRDLLEGRFPGAEPPAPRPDDRPWVSPRATVRPPVWLGPRCRIDAGAIVIGPAAIGADCVVGAEAQVFASVLWNGAVVGPGARLSHSVALAGANVPPDTCLHHAVVTGITPRAPAEAAAAAGHGSLPS